MIKGKSLPIIEGGSVAIGGNRNLRVGESVLEELFLKGGGVLPEGNLIQRCISEGIIVLQNHRKV